MHLFPPARRRIQRTCLVLGAIIIGAATRLFGASYYVDYSAGADANSGTSTSAPWQHCPGDPAASAISAITSLMPGDTVIFKGGVSYVLTGTTGIAVRASGSSGSPISYDGNSAGTWGTGRARFTDNYGANGIAAFSASVAVSNLKFTNLDLGAIGGSATLPLDSGYAVPARPGTGLAFTGGVSSTTIDGCAFHDLGYSYNQKPMNAAAIAGAGVSAASASGLTISNCDFSHVASAIELYNATSLANVTISGCTFHDSVCWTIDLPPPALTPTNLSVSGCTETNNAQFTSGSWTGYGSSPRTDVQSVTAGANVTFNVSAAASPAAAFQWFKNGIAISGATNATYALTSVTTNDAATYTVVATNTAGTSTSNDAVLTVNSGSTTAGAPVITTQPVSQVADPFGTATFSVVASGSPAPTYQWLKNGAAIPGWTSATLSMSAVTVNDVATYAVVVTNSAGSVTSNSVTLSLSSSSSSSTTTGGSTTTTSSTSSSSSAPVITTQPVSQVADPFGTASFSVVASGSPTPTYQWLKNGVAISGWTSPTLSMSAVTVNDVATYSVVVTNSAGSVTSNSVTLSLSSSSSTSTGGTTTSSTSTSASAPVINTQPTSQTVATYGTAVFSVTASGSPAPTYQWLKNGTAVSGWTSSTLTIAGATVNDVATYAVVVTNSAGSVTSNNVTLNLSSSTSTTGGTTTGGSTGGTTSGSGSTGSTTSAPVITTQPVSQTVAKLGTAVFSVVASGSPTPTYQWLKNGVAVSGWTSSTLTISSATVNDVATYSVVVKNSIGSVTSNQVTLSLSSSSGPSGGSKTGAPVITVQPTNQTATAFGTATFQVTASGSPAPTYQWLKNGVAISGWTGATLTLPCVTVNDVASYSAVATNTNGSVTSASATLTIATTAAESTASGATAGSHLANLSVRGSAGTGSGTMVVGFVIAGDAQKSLLVRGVGPTLTSYGVTGALTDPVLSLYSGSTLLDSNSGWAKSSNAPKVAAMGASLGAFTLPDSSLDAALTPTLTPGAYTAQITGANADSGVALVELYDDAIPSGARLVNVSVRTTIGSNADSPIIGFVVNGTEPKRLLVRAIGPGLAKFGVDGVLADPQVAIFQGSTQVQQNDNWGGDPALTDAFASVGAFALSDPDSKDSAFVFTAAPGAYTAVVSGANNTSGVVLVEVYELP